MKRLIIPIVIIATFSSIAPTFAQKACNLYEQDAQQRAIPLKVYRGFGLNLNLIPTGKTIRHVWIGDPSGFVLSSDGKLCPMSEQNCTSEGATVVHLRQIHPLNFENLPRSASGSTLLTLIVEGMGDRDLYQFTLSPASGTPECSSFTIRPDSEKPTPVITTSDRDIPNPVPPPPPPPSEPNSSQTTAAKPNPHAATAIETRALDPKQSDAIAIANDIVYGLVIARQKGHINGGTQMYRKVQGAIFLLRRGKDLEEVAQRSKVPLPVLEQLAKWGQNRP
jgi:hypothetical protein